MAISKVSLKLLIDTKGEKVLFAEASKDFVDFLFCIPSLSVGTFIEIVDKKSMAGCLGNLYQSIENLDERYMQPNQNKNSVLKPLPPNSASQNPLLLLTPAKYYRCLYLNQNQECHYKNVTDNPNSLCPICHNKMSQEMTFVSAAASGGEEGYVKGLVTYMVMDDLSVMPMSTMSIVTTLNKFNVKKMEDLEERIVHLDMAEGLKLLKASLESKTVLTSVFFGAKAEP